MNTKRYKIVLPWKLDHTVAGVGVEVADLLDKQTGRTYQDGAYRVVNHIGKVEKTYAGETAWSDAERYARDLCFAARYAR